MKKINDSKTELLMKKFDIRTPKRLLARNEKEAVKFSKKVGYPVVMKISSPDISHKSDVGGVITKIKNDEEAKTSYNKILKSVKRKFPNAKIDGVTINESIGGVEVIIGSKRDPQFGPVIMFGLGGVFVEIFNDVAFRLIPISRKDAKSMIEEIKGYKILKGYRGYKAVNMKALEEALLNVSKLIEKNPKIQEFDINPVMVDREAIAVDVRIIEK